jgi:hypothetical protein
MCSKWHPGMRPCEVVWRRGDEEIYRCWLHADSETDAISRGTITFALVGLGAKGIWQTYNRPGRQRKTLLQGFAMKFLKTGSNCCFVCYRAYMGAKFDWAPEQCR